MTKYLLQQAGMVVVGCVLAALHMWAHTFTISFFILPVTLSVAFVYMYSNEYAVFGLVVLAELFSGFPPGVMTAVVALPWLVRRLFAGVEVDISGTFLLLITATVGLQLLALNLAAAVISTWQTGFSWQTVWYSFPLQPWLIGWGLSGALLYVLIILWDGIGLSTKPPTQPRYDFR